MSEQSEDKRGRILELARERGVVTPGDVAGLGVSRAYLGHLAREGTMLRTGRGLYTLADFEATESHSLVEAVRVQSRGVVCLLSALAFHNLGTQLPHQVWLAVPYGSRIAKANGVPLRVVVARGAAYGEGVEVHRLEGVDVPVYGVAKTVADLFKFRNKVGVDVAIEALKEALRERRCPREEIRRFARIDRVERVMAPYMEVLSV